MDIKKIFQPKIWYIVCGAAALLGGSEHIINAETWAESAWGSYNDQSIAHETFFGLIFAGFGLMSFVSAFVLSGTMQAKFAMANGGVMLLIFIMIFVVLPTTGYNLPGVAWLITPFILMGALITSGYLHMNEEDSVSAEA